MGLEFHPYADLFDPASDEELKGLAEGIRRFGQQVPIKMYKGQILDGRNRARACELLGIEPVIDPVPFSGNDAEALDYVVTLQIDRRNLDESQRAMAAMRLPALKQGRPGKDANLQIKRRDAARMFKVSERSIASAATVHWHGAPELKEAVWQRWIPVYLAAKLAKEPKEKQARIVQRIKEQATKDVKKALSEQRRAERLASVAGTTLATPVVIHDGECIDAMKLPAASVDYVITDPPYAKEAHDLYDDLGRVSAHVLKPGGLLLAMVGNMYLPELMSRLAPHLNYHWTMSYLVLGSSSRVHPRRVIQNWKPILIFVKGHYEGAWFGDVARSDANDIDKDFHEWGQSESGMRDLMRRFVLPGQVVLDPFLGGGTTGVIAKELGAEFHGFEKNDEVRTLARRRLGVIAPDPATSAV